MAKSNRDEFPPTIKNALRLRANNECSFPNCTTVISGPSLESPTDYVSIGVAAHIHAAAPGPGARRYLATMSPQERSDISNGIWLCRNHATEIDGDEVFFTAERLRGYKAQHEERITARRRNLSASLRSDFIALGPDLVLYGEVVGATEDLWTVRIDDFLIGDLARLTRYIDSFGTSDQYDRYVVVNTLGDGRKLSKAPSWTRAAGGFQLSCPILGRFARKRAQDLEREFALNDAHDICASGENWTVVSGLGALAQRIKSTLSLIRGESPMSPTAGTRIVEHFTVFNDSSLLADLVKLETIRAACIPYVDTILHKPPTTLLGCVQSVRSVEQLSSEPVARWLRFRFVLEVEGVDGLWEQDISVLVQRVAAPGA